MLSKLCHKDLCRCAEGGCPEQGGVGWVSHAHTDTHPMWGPKEP